MKDREYDIAYLEIKLKNDELEREWYLWKLGRRGELLDADYASQARVEKTEGASKA